MSIRINEHGKEDYQPIYDCTVREYRLYDLVSEVMFDGLNNYSSVNETNLPQLLINYVLTFGNETIETCLDFCDYFPYGEIIKPEFKRLLKEERVE